jgi:hypothetical protein
MLFGRRTLSCGGGERDGNRLSGFSRGGGGGGEDSSVVAVVVSTPDVDFLNFALFRKVPKDGIVGHGLRRDETIRLNI